MQDVQTGKVCASLALSSSLIPPLALLEPCKRASRSRTGASSPLKPKLLQPRKPNPRGWYAQIMLIDFEYGGFNYCAFDIGNHFNMYAGGTDQGPMLFPSPGLSLP